MFILSSKKQCTKCGEWKSKSEYHKNSKAKDGLYHWCKECARALGKNWYNANKERGQKTALGWYHQNKEKAQSRNRKWIEAHPEKIKEYTKKRNEEYPYHSRDWRLANPEKARTQVRNRRAKKKANGGRITTKEWLEILEKYGKVIFIIKSRVVI